MMITPMISLLILGGLSIWAVWKLSEEYNEKESLKNGIIKIMKKLKPKQNITIHYGNEKQLTFIGGKLQ